MPENSNTKFYNYRSIAIVIGLAIFIAGTWFGLSSELSAHARLAFIVFGLAVGGWIFTKINGTYIALAAAITFTVVGVDEPDEFFEALGDSTVWLLLAAFIISAGVQASGLTNRLTGALIGRAKNVNQLFYLITGALILTAFVIPATSGRAALMIPVFIAISAAINDERITKALALLFPTIILLSAVASLIGAGAHLVTAEILWKMGGEQIGFAEWFMLGFPFAVVSCVVSTFVILRIFLNREERSKKLTLSADELPTKHDEKKNGYAERFVVALIGVLILLWLTQSLHGFSNSLVAVVGALVIAMPKFGVIGYKEALKSVNWNLLLFMAATLELGEALIESKAAEWLVQKLFSVLQGGWTSSSIVVVSVITLVSLLSHLFITSRTARASVLIPLIILLAVSLGYNPTTMAFLSTAAAGYCLTLTVSAKPVSMFNQIDGISTYEGRDLFRLSKYLLPIHFVLLLFFAFLVWPSMGLTLVKQDQTIAPHAPNWYENISRDPQKSAPNVETDPRPAATPWAIFGDYKNEENRRRLIQPEQKEAPPVETPPAATPPVEIIPEATSTPSPTPAMRKSTPARKPVPRRTPVRNTGDDDDDDDG